MQHAPTVAEALGNMLAFPELAWGHSRIVGALEGERFVLRFELGAAVPAGLSADVLREYCVTTDLASLRRMISDLTGGAHSPIEVTLPFRMPPEGERALAGFPYPVRFDQPQQSCTIAQVSSKPRPCSRTRASSSALIASSRRISRTCSPRKSPWPSRSRACSGA